MLKALSRKFLCACVSLAAVSGLTLLTHASVAASGTQVLAVSGGAAPDNNGTFDRYINPILNNNGQVLVEAEFSGTSDYPYDGAGFYRIDTPYSLNQIARGKQTSPDGNGIFANPFNVDAQLNDAGQTAFASGLYNTSPRGNSAGIFVDHSVKLRRTDSAPDGNGQFNGLGPVSINNTGQVAFQATLQNTSGNYANAGIFLHKTDGSVATIVRGDQAAPDGNGVFNDQLHFSDAGLNNAGQVAFYGYLDTGGSISDDEGIYVGDGKSLTQIARAGNIVPSSGGHLFSTFSTPAINSHGQVAFNASEVSSSGYGAGNGIFVGDAASVQSIVYSERSAPTASGGRNGTFDGSFSAPVFNDAGQVAFQAGIHYTNYGSRSYNGIFRAATTPGSLIAIARDDQTAPDGNGVFHRYETFAMNSAGQVAIVEYLSQTSGGYGVDDKAIYLYDDTLGLIRVARRGEHLLGSIITDLSLAGSWRYASYKMNGAMRTGLNDLGQVAYSFTLADGRSGVALWTLPAPEPATGVLAVLGLSAVALRRRRRA